MRNCEAGHEKHATKVVTTEQGEMTIFDWEQYWELGGYCPGQDDVSRTLDLYGHWEIDETALAIAILDKGDRNKAVIDVGAHLGWFSRLAVDRKYKVYAFEGEDDNAVLCLINNPVTMFTVWFNESTEQLMTGMEVELLKIDIEGAEEHAIRSLENLLPNTANIIMEVSPCFNETYPALVDRLVEQGFEALTIAGEPFDGKFDFDQTNLWFRRPA